MKSLLRIGLVQFRTYITDFPLDRFGKPGRGEELSYQIATQPTILHKMSTQSFNSMYFLSIYAFIYTALQRTKLSVIYSLDLILILSFNFIRPSYHHHHLIRSDFPCILLRLLRAQPCISLINVDAIFSLIAYFPVTFFQFLV